MAYLARYGRQPLSELRQLSRRELWLFTDELRDIVEEENTLPGGEDSG